jgi:putative addiction module antidote
MKLKLTTVGNSTGVIFPRELLERARISKGDELHVLETPDGILLRTYDAEFARQMDVAEKVMREHKDVLRQLAK